MNAKFLVTLLIVLSLVQVTSATIAEKEFYIYIYDPHVLPGEKPTMRVCGYGSMDIGFSAYKVDEGYLLSAWRGELTENGAKVKTWTEHFEFKEREYRHWYDYGCKEVKIPITEAGAYLIYGVREGVKKSAFVLISQLGVVVKHFDGGNKSLIYAVDLVSGKPLRGAEVKFYEDGKLVATSSTDDKGVAGVHSARGFDAITGNYQGNLAFISLSYYHYAAEKSKVYVYTDRPVYRPNQDVYFKAILWVEKEGTYEVASGDAEVEIKDAKGNAIYKENLTINEFGSISGNLTLGDEPPLGTYTIYVTAGGASGQGTFKVEEYRKPEYQVKLEPEKSVYIRGDTVKVDLYASYYFGKPVTNADVEYTIYRAPYHRPCVGYRCYYLETSIYPSYYFSLVSSGTTTTDVGGHAIIEFEVFPSMDSYYKIEAKVTDKSRRTVSGTAQVRVAKGEFSLEIATDRYWYAVGEEVKIKVISKDIEGNPIAVSLSLKVKGDSKTILERKLETDANGKAYVDFKPTMTGYYSITAEANDSRGNEIEERKGIWVRSRETTSYRHSSLELVLDKENYSIGESAKLMVNSPVEDFCVFITLEGDTIYEHWVEYIKGTSGIVEIPIKEEYAPNAYVGALVVKGGDSYTRSADLIIPPTHRFLQVEISSDSSIYAPRTSARFIVKTLDAHGKPIETELSLGLVDSSIYAIEEESTPDITKFFYGRRSNEVRTQYSWMQLGWTYRMAAQVYYEPMALPAPIPTPAPEAMIAFAKGYAPAIIRKYFPDTAFWDAHIVTGEDGIARVKIPLPDSLTTWRATVRGTSKDFKVGGSTHEITTQKNLIARLETPRFFTQRDELLISVVVHNYLGKMKDVKVVLDVEGITLLDKKEKIVTVAHNSDERVDFRVKADSCCTANLTAYALTRDESDAVSLTIPIIPHGVEVIKTWTGILKDGEVEEEIFVPEDSIQNSVELSILLSSSIAVTAMDSLEYLAGYPYGCVEQTMSRFLPNVMLAQVLKNLDIKNEELEKKLPDMVSKGLQRLYKFQHHDGGWGWWEKDESNPFMTAYVVYGLTQASRAGYMVDSGVLSDGVSSLKNKLYKMDDNTKAYAYYVLSFHESVDAKSLYRSELSDYAKALLALAAINSGDKETANFIVAELEGSAACSLGECYWSSDSRAWRNNDVETTSYVLMALAQTKPDSELVHGAVKWLVHHREGRRWSSTKDTATAIFALAEYLKVSKELSPDYRAKIYLNDVLVKEIKVTSAYDEIGGISLHPEIGRNRVKIVKEGTGNLYYSIYLRYYSYEEDIQAGGKGISITRKYDAAEIESGNLINVTLEIRADDSYEYVVIEDPIPSGTEVVEEEIYPYYRYEYRHYGYTSRREVRDEKIVFFSTYLPAQFEIKYQLRGVIPGDYHIMPTRAYVMYAPDVYGHSAENRVKITEKLRIHLGKIEVEGEKVKVEVNTLKLTPEEISGNILIKIRDPEGNVLAEEREETTIRNTEEERILLVTAAAPLADGFYEVAYSFTGELSVGGKRRLQVGEVEVEKVEGRKVDLEWEREWQTPGETPGLEGILAIAGLLAVAYLIRARRKRNQNSK